MQVAFVNQHPPGAEQFDTSTTIHEPFERLQSIDLALGLSIALRLHYGVSDCTDIVSYSGREPMHCADAALLSICQRDVQRRHRASAKKSPESHRHEIARRALQRVNIDDLPGRHLNGLTQSVIRKLRKKLANASGGRNYIETIWGRGYTLREPIKQAIAS